MKTAVSRSEVYSAALREYVARHDPDDIADALDPFVAAASQRTLEAIDW